MAGTYANRFKQLGKVLPRLWFDKIKVIATIPSTKGEFTTDKPQVLADGVPAKVSRKNLKSSEQSIFGTDQYDVVMYTGLDVKIPAGSIVWVTDVNGNVTKYKQTGKNYSGYVSHQEVAMVRAERS